MRNENRDVSKKKRHMEVTDDKQGKGRKEVGPEKGQETKARRGQQDRRCKKREAGKGNGKEETTEKGKQVTVKKREMRRGN